MDKMKRTVIPWAAALLLGACSQPASDTAQTACEYAEPAPLNPPTYICYKAPSPIRVDGVLAPEEWEAIPWTGDFVDIEGDKQPKPTWQTRVKMTYDEQGMYFAAHMEEPHVWGTLTAHDAVIFQDNDFEIFLDPTGDTHNYMEYEVNALGTTWDLFLSRPYRDNPVVLNQFEFSGMQSAVHVEGTLNDPSDTDKGWSVEVFIPWASMLIERGKTMPAAGDQLRVNFSRVEWASEVKEGKYAKVPLPGEDKIRENNWVWAPTGEINIHKPEYWGYVQISSKVAGTGEDTFIEHPEEEVKWILRKLYYRQNAYAAKYHRYASSLDQLSPRAVCPEEIVKRLKLETTATAYEISLAMEDGTIWHIRQDGLVWSGK